MEKIDGLSKDMEQSEREKLASVFPQCFVEGKLDIDKLLSLCGEYILKDFEKYEFTWKGKSECLPLAQQRSTATLRPCPEESVNFDTTQNLYIEGDNLEVLKLLQTSYFRKIKMIYIDPPYNTGNDFIYEDNFKDPLERYKEVTSQTTKSNPEYMGRFHTRWLNMMYPRLRLAANLLRDDGVIFISIDDSEVHNLRKLCDEIFGEENFLSCISISSNPRGRQADTFFATVQDYLLVYAKSASHTSLNGLPLNEAQKQDYIFTDTCGQAYRLLGLRQRGSASKREDRPEMFFPLYVDAETQKISLDAKPGYATVLPRKSDGTDGRWMWGQEKCRKELNRLVAKFIPRRNEFDIFVKDYLYRNGQERTTKPKTIWVETFCNNQFGTQEVKQILQGDIMPYPKPKDMLLNICRLGTGFTKKELVLDFFSGSATTAHAVMQLNAEDGGNRQFIMVQLPELCPENSEAYKAGYRNICEIGKERIRRAGTQLQDRQPSTQKPQKQNAQLSLVDATTFESSGEFHPLDIGFKVFKLDSSNLKTWDSTPFPEDDLLSISNRLHSMIDRIKPDRSDLDVVYEIMLKLGVPLTYSVTPVEITGGNPATRKTAYAIGDECLLIICLAERLTTEMIEEMADYAPGQIVLAEHALADLSAMRNAHYILRDRNIELKLV